MSRRLKPDSAEAKEYKEWILANHSAIERENGLEEGSLLALTAHESQFDPLAVSWSGASGAFQFTRNTGRSYGLRIDNEVDERFDYQKASGAAARYLADNLKKYNGDYARSIAQWNGGWKAEEAVRNKTVNEYVSPNGTRELDGFLKGVMKNAQKYGFSNLYDNINTTVYGGIPSKTEKKKEEPILNNFYDEYQRRQKMNQRFEATPIAMPSPIGMNGFTASASQATPSVKQPESSGYYEQIYNQYQLYKSGGSLIQYSGNNNVESILKGQERIYSRGDTKRLMELANKEDHKDVYFQLGKFLYDATKKQDSRPAEFTDD